MWSNLSNLNDSFSAITGSAISTLRQSISTFGDQEEGAREETNVQRDYETKISLLKDEVVRHRDIARLYKQRWLKAEEVVKSSTGALSEDYHDEIDLSDDALEEVDEEGVEEIAAADADDILLKDKLHFEGGDQVGGATIATSTTVGAGNVEEEKSCSTLKPTDHLVGESSHHRHHPHPHPHHHHHRGRRSIPHSITDLALNAATVKIRSLENELRKIEIDRKHWRTLSKQKLNVEEELEESRTQLEKYARELRQSTTAYEELCGSKRELEIELQELDAQHEAAIGTVIRMRDDALARAADAEKRLAEKIASIEANEHQQQQQQQQSQSQHRTNTSEKLEDSLSQNEVKKLLAETTTTTTTTTTATTEDRLLRGNDDERQLDDKARNVTTTTKFFPSSSSSSSRSIDDDKLDDEGCDDDAEDTESAQKSLSSVTSKEASEALEPLAAAADRQASPSSFAEDEERAIIEELRHEIIAQTLQPFGELVDFGATKVDEPLLPSYVYGRVRDELAGLRAELQLTVARAFELESRGAQTAQSLAQSQRLLERRDEQLDELEATIQALEEAAARAEARIHELEISASSSSTTAEVKSEISPPQQQQQQQKQPHQPSGQREEPEGSSISEALLVAQENLNNNNIIIERQKSESEIANLRLIENELKAQLVVLEQRAEEITAERDQLQADLDRRAAEFREADERHRDELKNRDVSIENVRSEMEQLRVAYDALGDEHRRAVAHAQQVDAVARANEAELRQLQAATARMSELVQEKDTELRKSIERIAELERHLSAANESADERISAESDRLRGELDRLRAHLVEVEENYTAELMESEKRRDEAADEADKLRAEQLDRATYEEQIRALITARDKARNECSALEDRMQQHSTSIGNLQAVIEQLEKEHERKLRAADVEHRAALEAERQRTMEVARKLSSQEQRLAETMEALEAASRLTMTIEQKEITITQLKREMKNKEAEIEALRCKILEFESSHEGKIDKQIVKSLVLSYFATAPGSAARTEGERLLARFLDFNQQEMDRAGIRIGRAGNPRAGSANDSFTFKFVEFLESESVHGTAREISAKPGPGGSTTTTTTTTSTAQTGHQLASEKLAHDLNKRLNSLGTSSSVRPNPFVPAPNSTSTFPHHQRTPSSASSSSSHSTRSIDLQQLQQSKLIQNQLLNPTSQMLIPPNVYLGGSSVVVKSASEPNNPDQSQSSLLPVLSSYASGSGENVVRDVIESDDKFI